MTEITKEDMRERLGNIDKIRDLLLGVQLREYDRRFDHIESEVSRLRRELYEYFDQIRKSISTELNTAAEFLETKLKYIKKDYQQESAKQLQQLESLNQQLFHNLQILDEILNNRTFSLKCELSSTSKRLHQEIYKLSEQFFQELGNHSAKIRDNKLSKEEIEEAISELSWRFQKKELVSKFKLSVINDTNHPSKPFNFSNSSK
ncbi:MAG: hypothetical protein F6K58_21625 [Symploca sp. SIO2E9]|nr:hypothetical protein [Symploca sp. SIO2E9]